METNFILPNPALTPFVEGYRAWDFNFSGHDDPVIKDYPRTALDIIFFYEGQLHIQLPESQTLHVAGASFISSFDRPYQAFFQKRLRALHVRFKSPGIYPLTRIPLGELLNNKLELEELNPELARIHQRLGATQGLKKQIDILEQELLNIYKNANLHHRLMHGLQIIEEHRGVMNVKQLAEQLNTNYKSLDRWFYNKVGLMPKRFMQITRFKNIIDQLKGQNEVDWMELTTDYGFHDQAHFIKEFQQFAHLSPGEFFASKVA